MIILGPSSTTLALITEIIIACHQRKVPIGLIISSNGIKTTPASRTSFQQVFMDKVKTVIRDIKIDKSVGGEIPIQIFKKSTFYI